MTPRRPIAFALAATLSLLTLAPSMTMAANKLDRTKRPPVGAAPKVPAPQVVKRTLSTGLPVWIVRRGRLPQVTAVLQIRAGAGADPRPGTASMTAALLDDGAAKLSARAFVDSVDFLGATLVASAGEEESVVSLHTLTGHLDAALGLMGDMVAEPAFLDEEVERERKARLHALKQQREQPTVVANLVFNRVVYGDQHPYGRPTQGTLSSVEALKTADVREFHRRFYQPRNATLIVVGDVRESDLLPRLERAFAKWKGDPAAAEPPAPPARPTGLATRVFLVDKPGAAQSEIRIGHSGAARTTSPDYYALQVMNTLLGGQFTSRVNLNLRERHGFTYGARSAFSFRRAEGPFFTAAGVFTAKTDSAVTEFLSELEDIRGRRPASEEEVAFARNALIRSYPRRLETNAGVATVLAELALHGLPESEITDYNRKVGEVKPPDVTRVAKEYIRPENLAIVVVGDVSQVKPGLESLKVGAVQLLDPEGKEITP